MNFKTWHSFLELKASRVWLYYYVEFDDATFPFFVFFLVAVDWWRCVCAHLRVVVVGIKAHPERSWCSYHSPPISDPVARSPVPSGVFWYATLLCFCFNRQLLEFFFKRIYLTQITFHVFVFFSVCNAINLFLPFLLGSFFFEEGEWYKGWYGTNYVRNCLVPRTEHNWLLSLMYLMLRSTGSDLLRDKYLYVHF